MSSREEQRGFKILKKILKNDIESSKNWHESINKISEARMFDFSLLKNKNEFDYQKKVVNAYIKENNLYRKRVLTYQEELIKELKSKNIDMNSNFMKGLISGINKSFIKKIPLLKKLINEHIRHGNNMILLLELLEKNKDIWEYKNNQIEINDDKILKEYGVLIKTISINREKIDILAKEITESL
jgi:hypothetical protein